MTTCHKLVALSAAAMMAAPLGAWASPATQVDHSTVHRAAHHTAAAAPAAMPAPDARMLAMQEMRDKMAAATTPEARQALMAAHMTAMRDGMQMMKGMPGMPAKPGMGAMGAMGGDGGKPMMAAKSGAKGMSADMAMHHQMMAGRMDMMQTMMEMMVQRMPAQPTQTQ
jgi:hypothetical protein